MKIGVDLGGSHIGVGLIDGENILKIGCIYPIFRV